MGAQSAVALRSERTIRLAPSAMAAETRLRTSSIARRSASPPAAVGAPVFPASRTSKRPSMAKALNPGVSPPSLTYISLARSSRSITGSGSRIWRHEPHRASSRLASGPMVAASDVTSSSRMASRRRVGHLGEELGEVVVQQARAVREHGDGGVRAHGADRLGPGAGHRTEDHPQLLGRVAEETLLRDHTAVLRREHGARRKLLEPDLVLGQPLAVGVLGRQLGLDLLVLDEPALGRVDQEHAARLQAALADHTLGGDVQHAHLTGQHDEPVVGDPVPSRPKPVAVEDGAHDRAVGEAHRGRAVPRLHQRRVVAVEGAARPVHGGVVLPGLGDHHQHGVRQRAPAEMQQLEHLVEAGRVARLRRADRVDRATGPLRSATSRAAPRGPASSCGCRPAC